MAKIELNISTSELRQIGQNICGEAELISEYNTNIKNSGIERVQENWVSEYPAASDYINKSNELITQINAEIAPSLTQFGATIISAANAIDSINRNNP